MAHGGPLNRARVLDFSQLLPGPYCSRVLADFGAEVIRIEHPQGGDWLRHMPPLADPGGEGLLFRMLNHGKKSLTLNLKTREGQAVVLGLVETSDVLLESFRPGVMERLKLGYERLSRINPRIVYCSLTGYGSHGPYRSRAGHDLNYAGLAGLLALTGQRDGPPTIPGVPIADLFGALWAAIGVIVALLERTHTGRGQYLETSLLGASIACLPVALARHLGGEPTRRGTDILNGGVVCYQVYETQDGKHVSLGALEPQFWAGFCRAIGREDLLAHQFSPAVSGELTYDALCALFRSRTRLEWSEVFSELDACCEPVYELDEALACPQVEALKMLADGLLLPPIQLPSQLLVRTDASAAVGPDLGQHSAEILAELGYDSAAVEDLKVRGVV